MKNRLCNWFDSVKVFQAFKRGGGKAICWSGATPTGRSEMTVKSIPKFSALAAKL